MLPSCIPYSDLKSFFKERSGNMGDEGGLFGKGFGDFITENRKAKNQAMALHQSGKQTKSI